MTDTDLDRNELDAHITGHWGEDSVPDDETGEDDTPEPEESEKDTSDTSDEDPAPELDEPVSLLPTFTHSAETPLWHIVMDELADEVPHVLDEVTSPDDDAEGGDAA